MDLTYNESAFILRNGVAPKQWQSITWTIWMVIQFTDTFMLHQTSVCLKTIWYEDTKIAIIEGGVNVGGIIRVKCQYEEHLTLTSVPRFIINQWYYSTIFIIIPRP